LLRVTEGKRSRAERPKRGSSPTVLETRDYLRAGYRIGARGFRQAITGAAIASSLDAPLETGTTGRMAATAAQHDRKTEGRGYAARRTRQRAWAGARPGDCEKKGRREVLEAAAQGTA